MAGLLFKDMNTTSTLYLEDKDMIYALFTSGYVTIFFGYVFL